MDGKLLALEAQDHFSHLVHADHLIASDIHWLSEVGLCQSEQIGLVHQIKGSPRTPHQMKIINTTHYKEMEELPEDTLDTFINESEGTGLQPITPHLKLISGSDGFSAESSRGLLPTTCMSN